MKSVLLMKVRIRREKEGGEYRKVIGERRKREERN
jgi:hypothetical protein